MEVNSEEECLVCGRELGVSRWVRGANQLRHSGRAVAEAVGELLGCEAAAGVSRLCFRCYRLLLGLDYHTHQMDRQRAALLRLYRGREVKETQTTTGNSYGTGEHLTGIRENLTGVRENLSGSGENLSGTGEHLTGIRENLTGIRENLTGVRENLSGTGENLSGTGGNLTGIRENLSGTGGNLTGIRENLSGAGENLTGIRENLSGIRENLSGTGDNLTGTGENLTSIRENLSGTGGNLTGTGENLTGIRENLSGIRGNSSGNGENLTGIRENLTGVRENLSGTGENLSGTVGQERGNTETQARGENSSGTCTVNPCGTVIPCGTVNPCGTVDPCDTVGCVRKNMEVPIRGENSPGTGTVYPCGKLPREAFHALHTHEEAPGDHLKARQQTDNTSGGGGVCVLPGGSPQKESLAAVSASKAVFEGDMDEDKAEMIDIDPDDGGGGGSGGGVGLCGTPQTDSVAAMRAKEDCHAAVAVGPQGQELDIALDADYSKCSYDHEYHKNTAVVPVEGCDLPTITAGGHQEQHSLAAKRRKTAKKWDDFEYYEDESKTSEVEGCDGAAHHTPTQHFQLPLRTGKKKCPECKEEFSTKKAVLSHRCHQTKRKEREKVTYTCKGCLRRFLLRREYLKHADACYKNTPVTCNLCLVKLPSAAYLPRHLAALHQVKPPLSKGSILCEACGRGFSRKEALERHEARVHGKAHGSHQCPLCGRTFPHTSLLAEHLRAHQGYTCPECSKVFSCRSNLTLHRRAHHMRKAAYHCTACNKHWKFHASYTYHMKKFHGSSEQRCGGCRLVVCSAEELRQHSLTCRVHHTQSTGQEVALEDMQGGGREVMKPLPNIAPGCGSLLSPAHLSKKGTDSLVLLSEMRKMQVYPPPNTSHQAPPAGEIIVEVLEDTDADYQYIILVEDTAMAHFTMTDTAAIWNTSGRQ